ncbi:MAG: Uma2 family endonuclease [Acidobacteriota bacterium]|nr:Uma2 family endonuclease [Acidobacteriota bacterium]
MINVQTQPQPRRLRFTVDEYYKMIELGMLGDHEKAEIPEVWIVNLPNDLVEVHTKPSVGLYRFVKIFKRGEIVKSEVLPELSLSVDKILG